MEKPTECRWCGCGDIERESPIMQSLIVSFACGTMSDTDAGGTRWLRDQRCAGPVGKLYKRIRRAVEVLEGARRYDIITGYESYMERRSDGEFIEHDEAEQALEILKGETDGKAD